MTSVGSGGQSVCALHPSPPPPPPPPPKESGGLVELANDIDDLTFEVALPPLDCLLIHHWVVEPARRLGGGAGREAREGGEADGMVRSTAHPAMADGRRQISWDASKPLSRSSSSHAHPRPSPSCTPTDDTTAEDAAASDDGVGMGSLRYSQHADYYGPPAGPSAGRPDPPPPHRDRDRRRRDRRAGGNPRNGGCAPVDEEETRREGRAAPRPVEYQRLFELRDSLLRYRDSLRSLLDAVRDQERVWTALRWWCRRIAREKGPAFHQEGMAYADPCDASRSRHDDAQCARGGVREADGNEGHRPPPPPPATSPLVAVTEKQGTPINKRVQLSTPRSLPCHSPRARGPATPSPLAARAAGMVGGRGFTPSPLPGRRGSGGEEMVLPHAMRSSSVPPTALPKSTATGAITRARRRLLSVDRDVGSRCRPPALAALPLPPPPPPPPPLPQQQEQGRRGAERPVSALADAVPRSPHAACALYYMHHLRCTGVVVVRRMRQWRRHLTHTFPLFVRRMNYSLEMLLQAVRLAEDPSMQQALSRCLPPRPHSLSAQGRGGGMKRCESGTDHERRRARRAAAQSAASWPAALTAFPLASAYPHLSAHGSPPPPYLAQVAREASRSIEDDSYYSQELLGVPSNDAPTAGARLEDLLLIAEQEKSNSRSCPPKDHTTHARSSSPPPSTSASAASAERWLSQEVSRQLRCCHACMAAAVGLNDGGRGEPLRAGRPVLLLRAAEGLLQQELATAFAPLVARDGRAAQLWGQWVAEVDVWYRHLEDASSSMDV